MIPDRSLKDLLMLSITKGFVTFDDVIKTSDMYNLSLSQMDELNESLYDNNIIVLDKELENISDSYIDYSHANYDLIYKEILKINPELSFLIDYIKKIKPLQHGEVSSLILQLEEGNPCAKERLFNGHQRVVVKTALSISKRDHLDLEDAISAGFEGLMEALEKYNSKIHGAFQSYASMWILQKISRLCNPTWFCLEIPFHKKVRIIELYKIIENKFGIDNYCYLNTEQKKLLSFKLGIELKEIESLLALMKLQLDGFICIDSLDLDTMFPFCTDTNLLYEELDIMLNRLTEREEMVLRYRYGLTEYGELTLEEIGRIYNVTRERIRQIEKKAMRKLRNHAYTGYDSLYVYSLFHKKIKKSKSSKT